MMIELYYVLTVLALLCLRISSMISTLRNFFSKSHMVDELTIYFDHRPLLRTHLRYPKYLPSTSQFSDKVSTSKPVSGGFYKVQIGSNFDGALGGIGLTMGIEGEQQGGEHVFLNTVRMWFEIASVLLLYL